MTYVFTHNHTININPISSEMRTFFINQNSLATIQHNVFTGQKPGRLFFCFLTLEAYQGMVHNSTLKSIVYVFIAFCHILYVYNMYIHMYVCWCGDSKIKTIVCRNLHNEPIIFPPPQCQLHCSQGGQ